LKPKRENKKTKKRKKTHQGGADFLKLTVTVCFLVLFVPFYGFILHLQ
jgi:hypothetical protein